MLASTGWTPERRRSPKAMAVTVARVWFFLDTLWHSIGLPVGWVCDRYDLALGLTRDELTRR